jgi:hypothetical protein
VIPDDIIDQAARAEFEADQTPENLYTWDEALPFVRKAYRDRVTAALSVLEPAMRRLASREIAAELAEHLQWQRDTGCHKMTGTPEIGRYIGMEDAWIIVRKFGEVTE